MYDLIKFTKPEHVDSILRGELYMNTIGFFWENGTEGQQDWAEGTEAFTDPSLNLPDNVASVTLGDIAWRNENYKYTNVFCLYRLDRYQNQVLQIDRKVCNFGDIAIHITNADRFIQQVQLAMKTQADTRYCCGDVAYYPRFCTENRKYQFGCFCKQDEYAYQKEWRIAVLHKYSELQKIASSSINEPYLKPYTLNIGRIDNISSIIPADELVLNPYKYFLNQNIVKKLHKEVELTPELADHLFRQGITFPRNALDGAYWGNCEKDEFEESVRRLNPNSYRPTFVIG